MSDRVEVKLALPPELFDAIVERTAAVVLERLVPQPAASEFLTVEEAAEFLRCSRQRIYDLLSDGRLTRHKEGSRVLVRRADVVAHLRPTGNGSRTGRRSAR